MYIDLGTAECLDGQKDACMGRWSWSAE